MSDEARGDQWGVRSINKVGAAYLKDKYTFNIDKQRL